MKHYSKKLLILICSIFISMPAALGEYGQSEVASWYYDYIGQWNILEQAEEEYCHASDEKEPYLTHMEMDRSFQKIGDQFLPDSVTRYLNIESPDIGISPDFRDYITFPEYVVETDKIRIIALEMLADPYRLDTNTAFIPKDENIQIRPMDCLNPYAPHHMPLSYYGSSTYFVEVVTRVCGEDNGLYDAGLSEDQRELHQLTSHHFHENISSETLEVEYAVFIGHYENGEFIIEKITFTLECPVNGFIDECILPGKHRFREENLILQDITFQISPIMMYIRINEQSLIDNDGPKNYSWACYDTNGQWFRDSNSMITPYQSTVPDVLYLCIYQTTPEFKITKILEMQRNGNKMEMKLKPM